MEKGARLFFTAFYFIGLFLDILIDKLLAVQEVFAEEFQYSVPDDRGMFEIPHHFPDIV